MIVRAMLKTIEILKRYGNQNPYRSLEFLCLLHASKSTVVDLDVHFLKCCGRKCQPHMVAFRCHVHLAPVSFVLQTGCSKIKPNFFGKIAYQG